MRGNIHSLYVAKTQDTEHANRVSYYCRKIGKAIGLSDSQIEELSKAGLLHDIGKAALPPHILNKNGPLTKQERKIINTHPEIAYRILHSSKGMKDIALVVLAHHERYDGRGYPHGLTGEEIPLHARILTVADAFDAMTSDRPYRRRLSLQTAIGELQRCAGTQFDPEIVEIFITKVLAHKKR
jgi:HD-GYP domain-containing protein (c-di-GMP phosphodiesterase class II)